jgi:hypothetical protein
LKEAFPEGSDKIYRGAAVRSDQGLTSTAKSRDFEGEPQFFSEDRSQAEQYAKSSAGGRETVGADYADRSSGVYEMAYPPNTPRIDLDTRGSGFSNIELFSEKTVPELESQASELKEVLKTAKNPAVRSNAAYNLDYIQEALKYIKENPTPRKVSSDAEVKEFIKRYRDWVDKSGEAAIPGGMLTDDIAMFMEDNPDLYDRIVMRGLDDESIGDVNIINAGKAPFPKSLKGNVGTFDLNDPNVFKAMLPIVGAAAAVRASRGKVEENSMFAGGKIKVKKKAQQGMRVLTGDPKKVKALDAQGNVIYVDDPEMGHDVPQDSLDVDMLKRGISMAESLGGVLMMNPESSATGLYGQLWNEVKDMPQLKGYDRDRFAKDLEKQEEIFNLRLDEGISGPSLRRNALELTEEYAPQLGEDWGYSLNDVAALTNYIGRQGTREYFASIRDGEKYEVPGTNLHPEEYLDKFRRGSIAQID